MMSPPLDPLSEYPTSCIKETRVCRMLVGPIPQHPTPPTALHVLLSAWIMGPGLTPLLPPLPQLSHKLHKRFHLLQVGILKHIDRGLNPPARVKQVAGA